MSSPGRKGLISVSHGISHSPGTALREKKHISPLLILHKKESFREYFLQVVRSWEDSFFPPSSVLAMHPSAGVFLQSFQHLRIVS